MIYQKNNKVWFKLNGLLRFFINHTMSSSLPLFIVNEYPKSGGSWLGQMLAESIKVPFPRNRLPMLSSSIMHGHYIWPGNMKNIVILWRDGRDILISQYYHSLFENEKGNKRLVELTKKELVFPDYTDISSNLCEFMKYVFEKKRHPKFSWADFYDVWGGEKCCACKI